ncbi:MAG: AraC family ligand binding domain-containing protein [Oscillibacter sp.]|nr:AraC family ligand binding domain-containing protein [Oscillibacter sp.]
MDTRFRGRNAYYIDGERITLEQGDALFVNARRMHYGYGFHGRDCRFTCILFHPSLFTGSGVLLEREVRPVLEHSGVNWRRLEASTPAGQEAALLLSRIAALKKRRRRMNWRLSAYFTFCGVLWVPCLPLRESRIRN